MLGAIIFGVGVIIFISLIASLAAYTVEWVVTREFGEWKISYRDFTRWYEQDPYHWTIFDSSNVQFSGGGQEVYCYFGFFGLMAYKRFYKNFICNKTPRKHRQSRAKSREKIDRLYDMYGYPEKGE